MENIKDLLNDVKQQIASAQDLAALEQIRVQYLGKKGSLTTILKQLRDLPSVERPAAGKLVNLAKEEIGSLLQRQYDSITVDLLRNRLHSEKIDVTLPGRGKNLGSLHPLTIVRERMEELFQSMGFDVADGPEIEDEFHNFTALNIPVHHPSRAASDTFYLEQSGYLLRTQTSPVQIREMDKHGAPIRVIAPGKVYRCDYDPTHVPMFHQLEGLVVDEGITFSNLKSLLNSFLENFFKRDLKIRFRPSYFPFTEPSAEVDLECTICGGEGCRICCGSGWIEVLGCGMIHPNVLAAVNIDSERFTGFAFGIGIDRFTIFKYQINDLRMLFDNDIRFLEQF